MDSYSQENAETSNDFIKQKLLSIERKLADLEDSLAIFKYGSQEVKKKHLEEYGQKGKLHEIDFHHKLIVQVRQDNRLSEPLKKLMEFMISQFDSAKHQFKELTFTQIKKEAPVSAGRLSNYLNALVEKGLLLKREDGYRAYYKTSYKAHERSNPEASTISEATEAEQTA